MAAKKKPASRASGAVKKGVRVAKGAVKSAKGAVKSARSRVKAKAGAKPERAEAAAPAAKPTAAAPAEKPAGALSRLKTGVTSLIGRLTGRGKKDAAASEGIEDAIADAPYDVSGVHKVSDQLARKRGREEDDVRFTDPSVVVEREGRGRRATTVDEPEESGSMSLFDEPAPTRGPKQRLEKIAALGRRRRAEAAGTPRRDDRGLFEPPDGGGSGEDD